MRALVCGVSGQDRAYRAHLPIDNGDAASGASREARIGSLANPARLGVRDRARLKVHARQRFRSQSSIGRSVEQPVGMLEAEWTLGQRR
jgi:GDPmannose 4,6-dehydratase